VYNAGRNGRRKGCCPPVVGSVLSCCWRLDTYIGGVCHCLFKNSSGSGQVELEMKGAAGRSYKYLIVLHKSAEEKGLLPYNAQV
jgi:hypothetical protein